jgi:hypothetical protein
MEESLNAKDKLYKKMSDLLDMGQDKKADLYSRKLSKLFTNWHEYQEWIIKKASKNYTL